MVRKTKRVLAVILAIATIWTGMPLEGVFAQEVDGKEVIGTEQSVSEESVQEESPQEEVRTEESVVPEVSEEETIAPEEKEVAAPETSVQSARIDYVFVENSYITSPGTQNIVIGVGDDNDIVDSAVLTYVNEESQERITVPMVQATNGAVLFSIDFAEGQSGVYTLESLEYVIGGTTYQGNFSENGMETKFGVDREVETSPDAVVVNEEEITSDIVTFDENGNANSQNSIEEALDVAGETVGKNTKGASGNVVVVLDPGHDNSHAGAHQSGLKEEELNLKIAKYCKAELEQYAGVTVYLTRSEDGSCPHPGTSSSGCNAARVAFAKSVGANVYVSLHLNSNPSSSPHGAEIYYPNGNYNSSVGAAGGQLADSILNKLAALGLNIRGKKIHNSEDNTLYPDGSLADYYGVIRRSKLEGIPAIIVEHAFMTNAGDVNTYLNNEEGLKSLGVADATGIAEYFGLHKGNSLQLNGVFCLDKGDRIEAGIDYRTTAQFVAFRWMAYNTSNGTWELLSDWSATDYISWKPGKGTYWLRVDAISSDGVQRDCTLVYNSERDYNHNYLNIKGIYQVAGKESISSAVSYETNDSAPKFRWMEYNVSKGTWKILSDWSSTESIQWKPEKGPYWLRVEAKTSDGVQQEYTLSYNNGRDYTHNYVDIKGIYQVAGEDCISSAVSYETNDSATKFRWMEYNVNSGTWKVLSDWGNTESIEWRPEAGPYWLRVEAKTSDGVQQEYTLAYNVPRDYTRTYVRVKGIYQIEGSDAISSAVSYETNDTAMKFRWMEYNVSKGTWSILSDWSNKESIQWKPEAGAYWLRVEARTSEGVEKEYTLAYNSTRDYTHNYVEIQGIYYKENYDGIDAGAVHQTNDNNTEFRWLVYNANSGVWSVISDWKKNEWVTWKPDAGNYWLRAEARTSDGRESNCTIVYNVEKYRIMGRSNTTLQQMVAYYRSKATYPSFYAGSDAPNIETFCRIYLEECAAEGVKAEVAFCQAMKETGFLRFGGRVPITAYNFGGLGAIDSDPNAWATFSSVREGIRAQVQHLKAYATAESLNQACVDPRYSLVKKGTAPYVEWLGQKENPYGYGWATAERYGYSIRTDYINKLLSY